MRAIQSPSICKTFVNHILDGRVIYGIDKNGRAADGFKMIFLSDQPKGP